MFLIRDKITDWLSPDGLMDPRRGFWFFACCVTLYVALVLGMAYCFSLSTPAGSVVGVLMLVLYGVAYSSFFLVCGELDRREKEFRLQSCRPASQQSLRELFGPPLPEQGSNKND